MGSLQGSSWLADQGEEPGVPPDPAARRPAFSGGRRRAPSVSLRPHAVTPSATLRNGATGLTELPSPDGPGSVPRGCTASEVGFDVLPGTPRCAPPATERAQSSSGGACASPEQPLGSEVGGSPRPAHVEPGQRARGPRLPAGASPRARCSPWVPACALGVTHASLPGLLGGHRRQDPPWSPGSPAQAPTPRGHRHRSGQGGRRPRGAPARPGCRTGPAGL